MLRAAKKGQGPYASIVELDIIEDKTDKLSKVEIWSGSPVPLANRSRIYLLHRVQKTCNQTVMSGGISISLVDFTVLLFDSVRIRCGSIRLILVRNWCGPRLGIEIHSHTYFGRWGSRYQRDAENNLLKGGTFHP